MHLLYKKPVELFKEYLHSIGADWREGKVNNYTWIEDWIIFLDSVPIDWDQIVNCGVTVFTRNTIIGKEYRNKR